LSYLLTNCDKGYDEHIGMPETGCMYAVVFGKKGKNSEGATPKAGIAN